MLAREDGLGKTGEPFELEERVAGEAMAEREGISMKFLRNSSFVDLGNCCPKSRAAKVDWTAFGTANSGP